MQRKALTEKQITNINNHLHLFTEAERGDLVAALRWQMDEFGQDSLQQAALQYADKEVTAEVLPPHFEISVLVDGWAEHGLEETTLDLTFEEALANGVRAGVTLDVQENDESDYGLSLIDGKRGAISGDEKGFALTVEHVRAKLTFNNGKQSLNFGYFECVQEALVSAVKAKTLIG